jgi:Flp pilus assembly protein TadG
MILLRAFFRDQRGASAAEFVLVLPVLALFVFGVINVGWFAWKINLMEKAVQAGARYAVVTAPVATGLLTENYVGTTYGLSQGQVIPASALGKLTCTNTTCACTGTCPADSTTRNATTFSNMVTRMQVYDPSVQAANVSIEYAGSGLGYAGDPSGMEIAPLVTVRLTGLTTRLTGFLPALRLPTVSASLTMEDGDGTRSN